MKKFKQIILILFLLPILTLGLSSCQNPFRKPVTVEEIIDKFESLNSNANIARFITDDLYVEINDAHFNFDVFKLNETDKSDYVRSLIKTSSYSMLGFNRFYKKLTTQFVKPRVTKDNAINLEDNLTTLRDCLLAVNNQFKIIDTRSNYTFAPSSNLHDEYIFINTVDSLNRLIDVQIKLSNEVLDIYYSVLDANPALKVTAASTDAFPGLLELDAVYNYIGFLDSFNKLFIQQLKATPLYSREGVAFDASPESPIFKLGDSIKETSSEMFEALSVTKHFVSSLIRDEFLTAKSKIEYFRNLKPALDTAISSFGFDNLKENVARLVVGDSEYTKEKLYHYVDNEQFDVTEQKFVYSPNSNISFLEKQQFDFVLNAFFNNFSHIFKPALETYLQKIKIKYAPLPTKINIMDGHIDLLFDQTEITLEYKIPTHYNKGSALNFTLPNAIKPNYEFMGWYTTPDFKAESKTTIIEISQNDTEEKCYYAKFIPSAVKVTFDTNGGTMAADAFVYLNMYEDAAPLTDPAGWTVKLWTSEMISAAMVKNGIQLPVREGYKLAGWALTSTGNTFSSDNPMNLSSVLTGMEIYAVWQANT